MISEKNKHAIIKLAKQYRVKRVLLFGSSISSSGEARDIDLAVEGVPPEIFFKFYGELLFSIDKPVDLVDLSSDNQFNSIIKKDGMSIYG